VSQALTVEAITRCCDDLEQQLRTGNPVLTRDDGWLLLESARRYLELTSALDFTAKATGNFSEGEGLPTFADALFETARELGWQGAKP
jgi:hypothetical protein